MDERATSTELAALLALAQDHAFGQPPGSQLRATVVAQLLASDLGLDASERATTWWTSTLRFLGCTGHAYETAVLFGDEIDLRSWSLRADASRPAELLRAMLARAGAGRTGLPRVGAILSVLAAGRAGAAANFRAACEVADAFAARLGLDDDVRASLSANFERWNGRGLPDGVRSDAIPLPMRIAQTAQELEVLVRFDSLDAALATIAERRGRAYDPDIVDVVLRQAPAWWPDLAGTDPWDRALALAPSSRPLDDSELRTALLVLADFADLKSPWMVGHSRAVAELATAAIGPEAQAPALLHDLGRVAVPNSIWDKPGALTRDERDRVTTYPLVTDQLLRRVAFTADAARPASAVQERLDGSGYHRGTTAAQLDDLQRVLAAADCYQAMVSERPHRPALGSGDAIDELRAMVRSGQLDGEAVERVVAAAGHRRSARPQAPAGLTPRELEVLRLIALGRTTGSIAEELVISPKTADRHVQNTYRKLGVSTRGAAALFAAEHGVIVGQAPDASAAGR